MRSSKLLKFGAIAIAMSLSIPAFADSSAASDLSTIVALDSNEILAAVQATNKKTSSDVADFAKMMIQEHGDNFTKALALADQVKAGTLNPNPNDMHSQGVAEVSKLAALDGDAYNKAYVDAMVKGHEGALAKVDQMLKSVKNADVKQFLTDTRGAVAHHLEEAKKLQANMKA